MGGLEFSGALLQAGLQLALDLIEPLFCPAMFTDFSLKIFPGLVELSLIPPS